MKKTIISVASLGLLATALSGCGSMAGSAEQANAVTTDVAGKIQIQPVLGATKDDGSPCTGETPFSLGLNGQQVKLKDASGEIVGVATLQGWKGDPTRDLSPDKYGYFDGGICSWDFNYPSVRVSSDFYTLEFSDERVPSSTITKEELINGPIVLLK